jgi:DNA-binding winged helix-turn-helix (wHTH) protein/TolB-like protein
LDWEFACIFLESALIDEETRYTGIAYVFGPFRLEPDECLLLRDGEPVAMTPRAFDLLRLLVESAGHLKPREDLIEALWPTAVVEDNSLPWNVSAVRKALGDSSEAPRYIETVPRRGYRFIAPVAVEHASGPHDDERHRHWPWVAVGSLVVTAVLAGVLIASWPGISGNLRTEERVPDRASIAVLPFENLNVDKKDAYFVAGIQDLILTKLADIGELKVISRTSTSDYQSHPDDLRTIARQLGVATILEGSVQKTGNQVLVNVQLIDARSGHARSRIFSAWRARWPKKLQWRFRPSSPTPRPGAWPRP